MATMGLAPLYQRPRTTVPNPEHRMFPYLLRDLVIERPNQVWCADITYIPMRRGFLYLVAVMDWATRKVLAWRVSNTMDTAFCVEALEEEKMGWRTGHRLLLDRLVRRRLGGLELRSQALHELTRKSIRGRRSDDIECRPEDGS